MPSPSPQREREEERRLNVRTLAIASSAAASAALVTSQLWFAGTWIAAAITPVIVALVSELLNRPTERIGRALTSDRAALFPPAEPPRQPTLRSTGAEPDPDAPRPPLRRHRDGAPSRELRPTTGASPVRVYRSETSAAPRRRRKLALGAIAATAAVAFLIAMAAITVPELIAGRSIGHSDKATTLLGGKSRERKSPVDEQRDRTTDQRDEAAPPPTTPEEEQPTETTPAPQATTPQPTTPAPRAAPPASTAPEPTPTAPTP